MTRALHVSALCVLVLVAGCSGFLGTAEGPVSPETDSRTYNHAGADGRSFVDNGISYGERGSYAVLITNESATKRFNYSVDHSEEAPYKHESAAEFIGETNFSSQYLIMFQHYPISSSLDTSVETVTRIGDRVVVNLSNPLLEEGEVAADTDLTVETVIIRVHAADRGPPRSGRLRYAGLNMSITASGNKRPCMWGIDDGGDVPCVDR